MSRFAQVAALVIAVGCTGEPSERIVGVCVPTSEATPLVVDPAHRGAWFLNVGMNGDLVVVSWMETGSASYGWVQRLDGALAAIAEPELVGTCSIREGTAWLADGEDLVGFWPLDVTLADPAPDPQDNPTTVRVTAAGVSTRALPLQLDTSPCHACAVATIGSSLDGLYGAGTQGHYTGAALDGDVVWVGVANPPDCPGSLSNPRPALIRMGSSTRVDPTVSPLDMNLCDRTAAGHVGHTTGVPLDDGGLGLVVRHGQLGQVGYVRLDPSLQPVTPILPAGRPLGHSTADDGYQPTAAAVADGGILFAERVGGLNYEQLLRVLRQDGSEVHDAPWQMASLRDPSRMTTHDELASLPDGNGVIVWNERARLDTHLPYGVRVTSRTDWDEGIYLAMLTPQGQLGSARIRVTGDEATALAAVPRTETSGPTASDFQWASAVDGPNVIVAWLDRRQDAPGIYARTFRCEPTATP